MRTTLLTIAFIALGALDAYAGPCKTQGSADAKELKFDWENADLRKGLFAAVDLGLSPPTYPISETREAQAPCSRGSFAIGSDQFELFGENEDGPPRWTTSATKTDVLFYLALMPKPEPALSWAAGTRPSEADGSVRFSDDEWMWALVVRAGLRGDRQDFSTDRQVIALWDRIPGDDALKGMIKDVAEGRRTGFATYNDFRRPPKFELRRQ